MPVKPTSRARRLENGAFLRALRRTGNVREAAREIGRHQATMRSGRRADTAFCVRWDAAIVSAQARLRADGARAAGSGPPNALADPARAEGFRTVGGEEVVILRADGTLQVRRARPGGLTRQCEQAFLAALSATANVALSAAATGAGQSQFCKRKRVDPGFAREWRLALQMGYDRLEEALIATATAAVDAGEGDGWRHNDPPPVPPMTAGQAIQLLHLYYKQARLWATRPDMYARRPGETGDAWGKRRGNNYIAELARAAEDSQLARVARAQDWARRCTSTPRPRCPR